jgi:hypothetical protein
MKLKNLNPIGCFIVDDEQIWKVRGFFDNSMIECVEYFCEREEETGSVERKSIYEDYQENLMLFSTWEQAELCRLNLKIGKLESFIDDLSDTFDEVREVYRLY